MEETKHDKMKYRLADAMKNCMKKMPVEKITVKEIVTECGTTRQTFYRNFQDKYDLINWYFDRILLESFQHMGEGKTAYEGLVNKFHYIEEEKLFFKLHENLHENSLGRLCDENNSWIIKYDFENGYFWYHYDRFYFVS